MLDPGFSPTCVLARGPDDDRQGGPITSSQQNQWPGGVPVMPMGGIFDQYLQVAQRSDDETRIGFPCVVQRIIGRIQIENDLLGRALYASRNRSTRRALITTAASEYSNSVNPVMLPPGRARLSTKPAPTGSATSTNIVGVAENICRIAAVAGLPDATTMSGCSLNRLAAAPRLVSGVFAAQCKGF